MFARTKRLTLRPIWPEDAPAIAQRIAHREVIGMLAKVPWPYTLADAVAFATLPHRADQPRFAILCHEGPAPELIGAISVDDGADGPLLGYWLTPSAWGRGYASEAGRAVIDMARHALPIARLHSWHFVDNPASGRVLRKLGFRDTDRREPRVSVGRGLAAEAAIMELDLDDRPAIPIAA